MAADLLFLFIYDDSPQLTEFVNSDLDKYQYYIRKLKTEGQNIDLITLNKKYIKSYYNIIEHTIHKTRVIIFYMGYTHKRSGGDIFFEADNIFIDIKTLHEKIKDKILNLVIFNCCNQIRKFNTNIDITIKSNISTLFDFSGKCTIISGNKYSNFYCNNGGSIFTEFLINKFNTTYNNTLLMMNNIYNMNIKYEGNLEYDKYVPGDELRLK
jgi:hypothetical protein